MSTDPRKTPKWKRLRSQMKSELTSPPICRICGKPIDVTLDRYDPMSAHLDHIIPVAIGGAPYSRDNLQWLHNHCNHRKGDSLSVKKAEKDKSKLYKLTNSF